MGGVGRGNHDGLHLFVRQHRLQGGIGKHAVPLGRFVFRFVYVVNAGKRGDIASKYLPGVPTALSAIAYDRERSFLHDDHS